MSPDAASPPLSLRIKVLTATGILALLGYLGWVQLIRDEPEMIPAGFVLPAPFAEVPEAENGLTFLINEMEKRDWPELTPEQAEIIGWRMPWDAGLMQPLLDAAPAIRKITEQALEIPHWQGVMISDEATVFKRFIVPLNIVQAKAQALSQAGDGAGALEWWALIGRAAQRYQESSRTLAALMLGTGSRVVLDRALMQLLAQSGNSGTVLAQGMALLDSPPLLKENLMRAWAEEVREEKAACPDLRKHSTWPPAKLIGFFKTAEPPGWLANSRYKPQASFNLNARHFDMLSRLGFKEGREARAEVKAERERVHAESELSLWSFEPNRAGRVIAGSNFKTLFHIEKNAMTKEAARRCCRAAIAAKLWSLGHGGKRPTALTDLVPGYLEEVPLDPENNLPLRWDAVSGLVYSLGPDGLDNLPVIPSGEFFISGDEGAAAYLP